LYDSAKKDPSIKIEDYLRYSFINSGLCISANIARNAATLKPRLGSLAYTIQSLIELIKFRMEKFDIEVDSRSMNEFEGEEEI
jgi:diacylglycerol kinase family enzyme